MIGIVGIGTVASKVAQKLKTLSKKVKTVDTELIILANSKFKMNMEEWEKKGAISFPEDWINDIDSTIYCIVDGADPISGVVLKTLEQLSNKKITIFYLYKHTMTKEEATNNKICINILQEYTRSGVFEHMFIIDHEYILESILSTPELAENKGLNELKSIVIDKICLCVYTYQQIRHDMPIDGSILNFEDTIYRISSFFAVSKNEKNELILENFYPLKYVKSYSYILTVPQKLEREDLENIKILKAQIKNNDDEEVYLSIFEEEKSRFLIGFCSTNVVQESVYVN